MTVREVKHEAKLQEWAEKIRDCRSSGETVKDWCASHSVTLKTYYHW